MSLKNSERNSLESSIGVIASITAEPLARILKKMGYALEMAPFHQVHQSCFQHTTVFPDTPDTILILWRIEDYLSETSNPTEQKNFLRDFVAAITHLRQNFQGSLIINRVYSPDIIWHDATSIQQDFSQSMTWTELTQAIHDDLSKIQDVIWLDIPSLITQIGLDNAVDRRTWYLYRQPWTQSFWQLIATQINRLISARTRSPKKCLVLDADNTLWGGIIGEDGLSGIQLGEDFPGRVYRDFQKSILALHHQGVLLAIASKNNHDDVMEVLHKHDAMVLQKEHFVALEIHWQSKVQSLEHIAKKLNIGLDSIVFVDDSAKEIAEVEAGLPQVTAMMVPEEITNLPRLFDGLDLFDTLSVTDEDRQRTGFFKAEEQRKQAEAAMSGEDFIKSLNLDITVFKAQDEHLARITQLINKTNQFNLTTIRRSADEVKEIHLSSNALLYGLNARDRLGDYGLVGVAIVLKHSDTIAHLDSFLLSCRVLGRGIESQFLNQVIAQSKAATGCTIFTAEFRPTAKNKLAESFLSLERFVYDPLTEKWIHTV
jgi:FkbH-like protein